MCSIPGGNRGPANAYKNHLEALRSNNDFTIDEITSIRDASELKNYNIFWFYVRFDPRLYYYIINNVKEAKIVTGPNVLYEKPEKGPSDEWENWFVNNVESDYYCNNSEFYLNRVLIDYKKAKTSFVLPGSVNFSDYEYISNKKNDLLVYYKKRRIDNQIDDLFPDFVNKLKDKNINYKIIEYGNYQRENYLEVLKDSKLCVWYSIEDYCANAQLESLFYNTPVIGTPYNNTHTFDMSYNVDGSNFSNNNWISWKNNVNDLYIKKYKKNYLVINLMI